MKIKKLHKRHNATVVPLLLSLLMTCVVSAISVLRTQGLSPLALQSWPSTWLISWVLLVMLPLVRRLVDLVVEN
jgi:hypothetical protein